MKKILMIEDYPIIQDIYKQHLDKHFDIKVVNDGEEALELLKHEQFDFILLDMLLPSVNGEEFLEKFSEYDNHEKTNIIVLSDFDYPKTVEKALKLGASEYWLKVENTPTVLAEKLLNYDD